MQYFSRFYAWYLFRTNHPQSSIAPFETIKKQFGQSRKLLRIGKNVEHFKAATVALDLRSATASPDPVLRYLAVGRQLGYAFYLTFDMMTYLDAAGIRKMSVAKKLQIQALRAWLSGLMCSAIAGLYSLWRLKEREKAVNKKDGEGVVEGKKIERYAIALYPFFSLWFPARSLLCVLRVAFSFGYRIQRGGVKPENLCHFYPLVSYDNMLTLYPRERAAIHLQLLSDLCDLTSPTSALGYIRFDDGIVGIAGTISSLLGVWGVWKKTS